MSNEPFVLADTGTETLTLRSQQSDINSTRSLPIFTTVQGPKSYWVALDHFCRDLLRELEKSHGERPSGGRALREKLICITHLVHSLAYVVSRPITHQLVAVSLDQNQYGPDGRLAMFSYSAMRAVVEMLSSPGEYGPLCRRLRGTYNRATHEGVTTRLEPNRSLKDRLAQAGLIWPTHPYAYSHSAPEHFLQIQFVDGGELYAVDRPPSELEAVIPKLNARLKRTRFDVRFPSYAAYCKTMWDFDASRPTTTYSGNQLARRFKYDLDTGGRLYGHFVQWLSSDLRPHLLMNGSPVVEYDYSGMMVHMAYASIGEVCPLADPYSIPNFGARYREVFKAIFVRLIGSDPDANFEASLRFGIQKALGKYPSPDEIETFTAAFFEAHPKLRSMANTSAWRGLQLRESEVSLKVLSELEAKGITCIPIFDGFIVKQNHEDALSAAMDGAVRDLSSKPGKRKVQP